MAFLQSHSALEVNCMLSCFFHVLSIRDVSRVQGNLNFMIIVFLCRSGADGAELGDYCRCDIWFDGRQHAADYLCILHVWAPILNIMLTSMQNFLIRTGTVLVVIRSAYLVNQYSLFAVSTKPCIMYF